MIEIIKYEEMNIIINHYGPREDEDYEGLNGILENFEKIWNNIFCRTHFSNEDILELINENNTNYFGNQFFTKKLMDKIQYEINDFTIEGFYSNLYS